MERPDSNGELLGFEQLSRTKQKSAAMELLMSTQKNIAKLTVSITKGTGLRKRLAKELKQTEKAQTLRTVSVKLKDDINERDEQAARYAGAIDMCRKLSINLDKIKMLEE